MRINKIDVSLIGNEPIYKQLYNFIKSQITSGNYTPGDILPSSRGLATTMNISRTSVLNAYKLLMAEGYILSVAGSGYRINNYPIVSTGKIKSQKEEYKIRETRYLPFNAEPIDLSFFPFNKWAKMTSRISRENLLSFFSSNEIEKNGIIDLRKAICTYLLEMKGIDCSPEQILVTSGAMESLEISINILAGGGCVGMFGIENIYYPPMFDFLSKTNHSLSYMKIDHEGACPDLISSACKAVIITPGCQFPLGITMSYQRRMKFIKWASINKGWIIEDAYDSEFSAEGKKVNTIFSLDKEGRTIYLGSFSRVMTSEFRVGFVVIPRSLLDAFINTEYTTKVSYIPQVILAEFMKSGEFYRNLVKAKDNCSQKKEYLLGLLKKHLPMYGFPYENKSGSFVVFLLKSFINDKDFIIYAKERGLDLKALSAMSYAGSYNGLLLGFVYFNNKVLKESIILLKKILDLYCGKDM